MNIPYFSSHQVDKIKELLGVESVEEWLKGIPSDIRLKRELEIEGGLSEFDLKKRFQKIFSSKSNSAESFSFAGAGLYNHYSPELINHLVLRGEFLTSYTPYQPEMAQGTLTALFEYQTLIARLLNMDVVTASHYDGATSMAEAALMAIRISKKRNKILISNAVNPEYKDVLKTYLSRRDAEIVEIDIDENGKTDQEALKSSLDDNCAAFLVQSPNFYGVLEDQENLSSICHDNKTLYCPGFTEALSTAITVPFGDYDSDIVWGEGQSFGSPVGGGGPLLGLFASKKKYSRQLPGRLCGETVDADGRRAFCLTMSTREQHIRREKATSNICSNHNLVALRSAIWLALMGKEGIRDLAKTNINGIEYLKTKIETSEYASLRYPMSTTFNEVTIDLEFDSRSFFDWAAQKGLCPGVPLSRFNENDVTGLLVAVTDVNTKEEVDSLFELMTQFSNEENK